MERLKRTIKKVAALAGGALMVGSAVTGALAALDNLPQPFVSSAGVFDSYIVVGTVGWNPAAAYNAAAVTGLARDVATGIDVGAAFAQRATASADGSTDVTTVSSGLLIEKTGEKFTYDTQINGIFTEGFSKAELDIFATQTYRDNKGANKANVEYNQKLEFENNAGKFEFTQDTDHDDKPMGKFLTFADSGVYSYEIEFQSDLKFSNTTADPTKDDFKGTSISIQGRTYTFSDAESSGGAISKLTLMGGAVPTTQAYGTTQTYTIEGKSYEVTVNAITQPGPDADYEVLLTVNGISPGVMTPGDAEEVDGLTVGVDSAFLDIVYPEQSSAVLFLGANKLVLEDDTEVRINEESIEDWDVTADIDSTASVLKKITITAESEEKWFLEPGDELVDPVFGAWKVVFGGVVEKNVEEIRAVGSSDTGYLRLKNYNDASIDLPVIENGTAVWGKNLVSSVNITNGVSEMPGYMLLGNDWTCQNATTLRACEGVTFLAVSSGGVANVFEIKRIYDGEYTLKDQGTTKFKFGETYTLDGTSFKLDQSGNDTTATTINNSFEGPGNFRTSNGGYIAVGYHDNGNANVNVYDMDKDEGMNFNFDVTDDDKVNINTTHALEKEIDDTDADKVGIDTAKWGTIIRIDDDEEVLTIMYPEEKVNANVYLAPAGATTTTQSTSGAVNINYINAATGIAKTDVDYATSVPTTNVILIGGPNANELVNKLSAAKTDVWTAAEYTPDTAVIQLVENAYGNNDALIIAGYDAKDTALAGKVVAARVLNNQFSEYLTGSKAVLSTSGASTINEVSFA